MSFFGMFGSPNVDKLKAQGDVHGLIKALDYQKNANVRKEAAVALGELGDTRVVEPLMAALKDKDVDVRVNALVALLKIGAPPVDPMLVALKDEVVNKRIFAALALGLIGDTRAMAPLVGALKDKSEEVRKFAAEALGKIGDTRAVEPLISMFKDEVAEVVVATAAALLTIGASSFDPLVTALKDEDFRVRGFAAVVLEQLGDARAVEPLVAALNDEHSYVRGRAAGALLKLQPPDPEVNRLLDLLDSTHITTGNLMKASEDVRKLMVVISLHVDLYPQSKEFFIRKALKLASSPNVEERLRAFLLLSQWTGEDSRVDKAFDDIPIPRSAL